MSTPHKNFSNTSDDSLDFEPTQSYTFIQSAGRLANNSQAMILTQDLDELMGLVNAAALLAKQNLTAKQPPLEAKEALKKSIVNTAEQPQQSLLFGRLGVFAAPASSLDSFDSSYWPIYSWLKAPQRETLKT